MMLESPSTSGAVASCADPAAPAFLHLLDRYRIGDSLFASPRGTWLGIGRLECSLTFAEKKTETEADATQRLCEQVRLLMDAARARQKVEGGEEPIVMGAVPFDVRQPAALHVPERVIRGHAPVRSGGDSGGWMADESPPVKLVSARPEPAPEIYGQAVNAALARFAAGGLDKVVLSRTLALELSAAPDVRVPLRKLAALNTRGYTYAVPLDEVRGGERESGGVFVGSTPELLVRREGRRVVVNPLAGSAARGRDAQDDERIGQALMQSPKDRREHAVVIDAVARALRPLCRTLSVPAAPSLVSTDALWHLSTVLEGELADEATTSLDLAFALHPTPAVGGYPAAAALDAIAELEPFDRGLFSGFVGWCDAHGDGEWAVTLRCAQLLGTSARLYAGAGIVPGSVPASEVAETQTKFRTMLRALGIDANEL